MATPLIYWIDANVLITAKDGPYRFAINPGFWVALEDQARAGTVRIPHQVYEEIVKNGPNDDLAKWAKNRRSGGLFVKANRAVQAAMTRVSDHVKNTYQPHHAAEFLSVADPWLIAHALDSGGAVVTFENRQPGAQRVKIPNVCHELGVSFLSLYDMLQRLGISFEKK